MPRTVSLLSLTGLALACGTADPVGSPAMDAGVYSGPLPEAQAVLPFERYDCRATEAPAPPARPAPLGCFMDPGCEVDLVAAHRMGTPFAPENSLSALRASILLGVDVVETDVRLTADGHVVLMHDGDVDRTTTGTGSVEGYTLSALRRLRLDDGPEGGDFSCERPATLDEVFAVSRGKIVVELEVKDTEAGVKAAEHLRDNDLYGQAFLLCSGAECDAIRARVPDAPIMTRPRAPEALDDALAYDPPPALVHIDATEAFATEAVFTRIHAVGAKAYANGFVLGDSAAAFGDDLDGYREVWRRGIEVQQVENPHWALIALGRLAP